MPQCYWLTCINFRENLFNVAQWQIRIVEIVYGKQFYNKKSKVADREYDNGVSKIRLFYLNLLMCGSVSRNNLKYAN